jgi:hypothetical protein
MEQVQHIQGRQGTSVYYKVSAPFSCVLHCMRAVNCRCKVLVALIRRVSVCGVALATSYEFLVCPIVCTMF